MLQRKFSQQKKQSKTRMNEKKLLPLQDALHHFIYIFPTVRQVLPYIIKELVRSEKRYRQQLITR